jgi:pimeloyl-ACP methyl ester carboxylesterase
MRSSWRLEVCLLAVAALVVGLLWAWWLARPDETEAASNTGGPDTFFRQEEIHFRSGGNTLAGVLVLPTTPGPHAAVVFLNGSGATDRTGRGLYPALWRHFARCGFASLAWDRPGVGRSTGDFEQQTFDDRAHEALDAVAFLRARSDIRAEAVGLWGFSQGGIVAPLAASRSADVAFLIEVSGCQTAAWQQDLYRVEAELRADGFSEADVAAAVAFAEMRMGLMRRAGSFEELDQAQQKVRDRPWFEYVHLCDRKRFHSGTVTVGFDPGPSWEKVRCPVLAIFGDKDTSCPVERSIAVVRRGLERAGNRDVTVKVFSQAGHAITVTETGGRKNPRKRPAGSGPEFAPGYLEIMAEWLSARFRAPEPR